MSAQATGTRNPAREGRELVWQLARQLPPGSPWALEYFKSCLGAAERRLGEALGNAGSEQLNTHGREHRPAPLDLLHFLCAFLVGAATLLAMLFRFARHAQAGDLQARLVVAVHGEWSNRTRHLLGHLQSGLSPVAIVVLGRPQSSIDHIRQRWARELACELPPVLVPVSWGAWFAALPDTLSGLPEGYRQLRRSPLRPPWREHGAIAFRVMLGAMQARWWRTHGGQINTAVFGHTGLGDTTQLEQQMQRQGVRTVHLVHGVCSGPNFVGFSSEAIFQCGADAAQYASLGHYGACLAPEAPPPLWQRGDHGVLLLTNLAHPMNPGYLERGIADELQVLHLVAQLGRQLGPSALPLRWKPHPALATLPATEQAAVRQRAAELGFEEWPAQSDWLAAARGARWVFTTPSTTAIDVLRAGCLPVLVDIQGAAFDGVSSHLPLKIDNERQGQDALWQADPAERYRALQEQAWRTIRPARNVAAHQLTAHEGV